MYICRRIVHSASGVAVTSRYSFHTLWCPQPQVSLIFPLAWSAAFRQLAPSFKALVTLTSHHPHRGLSCRLPTSSPRAGRQEPHRTTKREPMSRIVWIENLKQVFRGSNRHWPRPDARILSFEDYTTIRLNVVIAQVKQEPGYRFVRSVKSDLPVVPHDLLLTFVLRAIMRKCRKRMLKLCNHIALSTQRNEPLSHTKRGSWICLWISTSYPTDEHHHCIVWLFISRLHKKYRKSSEMFPWHTIPGSIGLEIRTRTCLPRWRLKDAPYCSWLRCCTSDLSLGRKQYWYSRMRVGTITVAFFTGHPHNKSDTVSLTITITDIILSFCLRCK